MDRGGRRGEGQGSRSSSPAAAGPPRQDRRMLWGKPSEMDLPSSRPPPSTPPGGYDTHTKRKETGHTNTHYYTHTYEETKDSGLIKDNNNNTKQRLRPHHLPHRRLRKVPVGVSLFFSTRPTRDRLFFKTDKQPPPPFPAASTGSTGATCLLWRSVSSTLTRTSEPRTSRGATVTRYGFSPFPQRGHKGLRGLFSVDERTR